MSGVPKFSRSKVPLRVIDLDATLRSKGRILFCEADPESWDFSVVSHVWNKHIHALIGAVTGMKHRWVDAIQEREWRQGETGAAYAAIRELLESVQVHGVKKIWMDALCINQGDKEEQLREIPLMGAYYRHSLGCYVPISGFGEGYRLTTPRKFVGENLPWLGRVWTMQEFLLPDRIHFLVELEGWMEAWLALLVAWVGDDVTHLCSCCVRRVGLSREGVMHVTRMMQGTRSHKGKIRNAEEASRRCTKCGSLPLLTRVGQHNQLYLVEREALLLVVLLADYPEQIQQNKWEEEDPELELEQAKDQVKFIIRNEWLKRAMNARAPGAWFSTFEILADACNRDCNQDHPEDRLRGILGVLGVDLPSLKLTSGKKPPEDELVELARQKAFTARQLLEMCLADTFSGSRAVSSWIPDLAYTEKARSAKRRIEGDDFLSLSRIIDISPEGDIRLSCKLLRGYAEAFGPDFLIWASSEPGSELHLEFKSAGRRDQVYKSQSGSVFIPVEDPEKLRTFTGFGMWVVQLCQIDGERQALLCLHKPAAAGNSVVVVHKVGFLCPRGDFAAALDELEDHQEVTIGSYGEFVDHCLDYNGQPDGEQGMATVTDVYCDDSYVLELLGLQPTVRSAPVLTVQPRVLRFPFELGKELACSITLTSETDDQVAFKFLKSSLRTNTSAKRYLWRPRAGLLPPKGSTELTVTMLPQKALPTYTEVEDTFVIKAVVAPGANLADLKTPFESRHKHLELELRIVLTPSAQSSDYLKRVSS